MSASGLPLVIVGGGLAGSIAAFAMTRFRPEIPVVLIEQGSALGGNHIWSFFDTDLNATETAFIQPFVTRRWNDHEVAFPSRQRRLSIGYNSIRSETLHHLVASALPEGSCRLATSVRHIAADHVVTTGGDWIHALAVIDARGPEQVSGLELGWQKFVGRTYRFPAGHRVPRPMIMDSTVQQEDGYRFIYRLPFSETDLMIEDTYYSSSPQLDRETLRKGLDRLAGPEAEVVSEEEGILPVLISGELNSLWPARGEPIARLGVAGGFFHPTTGYSLPDAAANALLLCELRDFSAASVHKLLRSRATKLWRERRFFQILNRMLFRAAKPGERYRVLEHFYRLPEPVIGRFYAARLTTPDKVRILSGRPPVPVFRALAAMRSVA